ncbi:MAG: hypothetical protein IT289_07210 [Oligoflexia bacterium]|nr:hypothetical protein [Oligoflexia bacterium]
MDRFGLNFLVFLGMSLSLGFSAHAGELICESSKFPGKLTVRLDRHDDRRSEALLELSTGPAGTIGIKLFQVFSSDQDNGEIGPYDVFQNTLDNGDQSTLIQVVYERQRLLAVLTIEKGGGKKPQGLILSCIRVEN